MATATKGRNKQPAALPTEEVLTLSEAAGYLRVSEDAVLEAVRSQQLPGRQVGGEWRFLKWALRSWLGGSGQQGFWKTHFGALRDDPFLEEMLEQIYQRRGRPMTEAG
jgi:excisionase family DNA binding protein